VATPGFYRLLQNSLEEELKSKIRPPAQPFDSGTDLTGRAL